jgi:hypothetical protein
VSSCRKANFFKTLLSKKAAEGARFAIARGRDALLRDPASHVDRTGSHKKAGI